MANESLSAAKAAKNDEFYTQYYDIEREINAYLEFDPDVLFLLLRHVRKNILQRNKRV